MTSVDAATLRELMRLLAVLVARRELPAATANGQGTEAQDMQGHVILETTLHDDVLLNQVCASGQLAERVRVLGWWGWKHGIASPCPRAA